MAGFPRSATTEHHSLGVQSNYLVNGFLPSFLLKVIIMVIMMILVCCQKSNLTQGNPSSCFPGRKYSEEIYHSLLLGLPEGDNLEETVVWYTEGAEDIDPRALNNEFLITRCCLLSLPWDYCPTCPGPHKMAFLLGGTVGISGVYLSELSSKHI